MQYLIPFDQLKKRANVIGRDLGELGAGKGVSKTTVWAWGRGDHEPRTSKLQVVARELEKEEFRVFKELLKLFGCGDLIDVVKARSPLAARADNAITNENLKETEEEAEAAGVAS